MTKADKKKKPENWREYARNSLTALGQCGWVWRELMNSRARRLFGWTLVMLLIASFFGVFWPYMIKWVIDGLAAADIAMVV